MAGLSTAYSNIVNWAITTVVIFAVLIFGGVFIGKTNEVGQSILTDGAGGNQSTVQANLSSLTGDYFTASGELSTVVITVISFLILAALLILLYYFVRALKNTEGNGNGPEDLI